MNQISIEDIGPIHDLRIPVSESGGVWVLLGKNGSGKSTAVAAVQALASGTGRIEQRDGAARGEVSAFGATLRVARRLSRSGELECASIEGRFSIEELVEPKLQDPIAADAKRIKALIQLSNAEASAALFYDIVGGQEQFDALVDSESIKTDDLVVMASRIKRDLESHSRKLAADAERDFTKAEAGRLSAAGVDTSAPHDQKELSDALSIADREDARLTAEAKAALESQTARDTARESLVKLKSDYTASSLSDAELRLQNSIIKHERCNRLVADLKRQLERAEIDLTAAEHERELATKNREQAIQHESAIAALETIVFAPVTESPSEQDLEAARIRLENARTAVETGVLIRKAVSDLENASRLKQSALRAQSEADRLRDAAKATDDVLSKAVQRLGCPLRVSGARLVTDTDRGEEKFADLSMGEKYSIAIPIAVEAVGKGGLIPLSQEAWQGLDPANKRLVASKVEGTGVILLTAQATDDEDLRAEQFEPFEIS